MNKDSLLDINRVKAGAFDVLLEDSPLGLAVLDRDQRYLCINETLTNFNGLAADRHIGASVSEVLPKLAPVIVPMLDEVLATGKRFCNFEVKGETPSLSGKDSRWLGSYLPIFANNDATTEVIGVLVAAENMTMTRQLERTREAANVLVRRMLDSLFAFVGILSTDGVVLDSNRSPLEAAGITLDDVVGKPYWDCFWWNYDENVQQQMKQTIARAAAGETVRYDVVVRMINDTRMTIDFMMSPLLDEQGRVTHLISSAIDVSARVASEDKLKFSEERFRRVVDSTADGLVLVDSEGKINLANRRAAEMFGYSVEELLSLDVEALIPAEQAKRHVHLRASYRRLPEARTMASRRELFAVRKDGSMFPVEVGLTPLTFRNGPRTLATVMDISVQKSIQEDLIRALDEKTSLLNEVHHRVKNNLQVVSSLLSLQTRKVPEDMRRYFVESQGRIQAMALIHQLLYEQKHFDQVDVVAYANRLIDLLKRSYLSELQGIQLQVYSNPEQIHISLGVAQPFGLYINELVTNCIKHAFVDRTSGAIAIGFSSGQSGVSVTVHDDGVGIPVGIDPASSPTLGFQLIHGLVAQMNGSILLEDVPGTCFRLELPSEEVTAGMEK